MTIIVLILACITMFIALKNIRAGYIEFCIVFILASTAIGRALTMSYAGAIIGLVFGLAFSITIAVKNLREIKDVDNGDNNQ